MSTPKRKLFAGADDSENEFADNIASFGAKKASPKKAAMEDMEINKPSSARRQPNSQKLEDTEWIRENYNVKTLFYFLEQCADILHKYNPILTGSSAILVYLVTSYQAGNLERQEFESMLKSLNPINDLDAVFDTMVRPGDFIQAGFIPQLKYAKKLPDILTEADGIPFVKDSVPLEPKTGDSVDKPIKIEVIIAKTVGKKREEDKPEIIEKVIELPKGNKINVRIYHPRSLLKEYRKMDNEDGKRDDKAKITVLRQLIDTGIVTPAKPSNRPSRFAGAASIRKFII